MTEKEMNARVVRGLPADCRTPQTEWEEKERLDMGGDTPVMEYYICRNIISQPPYNGLVPRGFRHFVGLV